MIDFNKDFEHYLAAQYKRAADDAAYDDADAADIYAAWADTPHNGLGGVSPRAYFNAMTSSETLIAAFIDSAAFDGHPCPLLLDRLSEVKDCGKGLAQIVNGAYPASVKAAAVSFLNETGAAPSVANYAAILIDGASDQRLADLCTEALCEPAAAAAAAPLLYPRLSGMDERQRARAAEILMCAPPDERTYALLTDLFLNGADTALYAWYLGKYGDERAAGMLFKKLDTCSYAAYLEIKNAIERMGGLVEDTRDFSDDKDYQTIKKG